MELFVDQIILEAVMVAGGTIQASSLLGVPQSSISRRARSFAHISCLKLTRKRQGYGISGAMDFFFELQAVARRFRYLQLANRWSMHPGLVDIYGFLSCNLPGQFYLLADRYLEDSLSFGLIDQFLDARYVLPSSSPLPLGLIKGEGFRMALVTKQDHDDQPLALVLGSLSKIPGLESSLVSLGSTIVPDPTLSLSNPNLWLLPTLPVGSGTYEDDFRAIGYVEIFWKYHLSECQKGDLQSAYGSVFELQFFSRLSTFLCIT